MDVSSLGTTYTKALSASSIEGGFAGEGTAESLTLRASKDGVTGAIDAVLHYDGADNGLSFSSSTGPIRIGGCSGAPLSSHDLTNKEYVDGLVSSAGVKAPVTVATTLPIAGTYNNGTAGVGATIQATATMIDGLTLVLGDRILIKDQINAWENGIYSLTDTTAGYTLTRTTDFDTPSEVSSGSFCFVRQGTTHAGKGFIQRTNGPLIIGVSALAFSPISDSPSIAGSTDVALTTRSNNDVLAYDGPSSSWTNKSITATLGSQTPTGGSLLVRSRTEQNMIELPPVTDNMAVLRCDSTSTARGISYTNLFHLALSSIQFYIGAVFYAHAPAPVPPLGVVLAGVAGTLIPVANFFNDPGNQLESSGPFYAIAGGMANAGMAFDLGLHTPGIFYLYKLQFSLSVRPDTAQVTPLTNTFVIVENYGHPSQLIYMNSAVVVDIYQTTVTVTSPPIWVVISTETSRVYDVCLLVGEVGANPSLFICSYSLTCCIQT